MQTRRGNILRNIDWITIAIYLVLVILGWINIYAAVYDETHSSILDMDMRYGKQLTWIAAALVISFFLFLIDSKFYSAFAFAIYGLFMFSLILVLFFGTEVNASRSWFEFGGVRLQPAEFAKMATALALAQFVSKENFKLKNFKDLLGVATIIGIPVILILLQNDTGSALVYASFIFVLYREGLNNTIFILFFALIALFIFALITNQILLLAILVVLGFLYFLLVSKRKV
ncbi:MAG: rod shape-determining protein RodA, partial [Bacteroidales bacterium]|nr:rod shape-determining protein RodA [Bacteroidales bacterium]